MDQQAKQQVIERIKQAESILVTVSTDPTVDQLAACIGSALMINRMDKRGTAIYSGKTPSTIEFLQPEKTLETNTDSLRDFIISLDKNKADKLRYKVEDKVVRIYITPYRTSIGEKDLQFTMGDYNVDLVLALGVKDQAHIDAAIAAHGKILHDAPIVCVNAGQAKLPNVGQINWQDPAASSLSEMMVSISEALGSGLIDNQIATAFLTGIVAETERFSNAKTSSKVMTMSAQLMAAGANQQLIAQKLAPPPPEPPPSPNKPATLPKKPTQPPQAPKNSGEISIDHGQGKKGKNEGEVKINPNEILIDDKGNIERAQELLRKKGPTPANSANQTPLTMPMTLDRENITNVVTASTAPAAPAPAPAPTDPNSPIKTFRHAEEHDMFDLPKPGDGAQFSGASQTDTDNKWYDPMKAGSQSEGFIGKGHDLPVPANPVQASASTAPVNPISSAQTSAPAPAPVVELNDARTAVESALANPVIAASAAEAVPASASQPVTEQNAAQPTPAAATTNMTPPAPPPVPPPIIGNVPVVPAPSAAKQYNQDGSSADPNSPNSAWPL